MPYIIIEDFRAGLDRRKLPVASPQGSLQTLSNAHVTRGGEIEKRRAMVAKYALPESATHGLAAANGVLYTFGSFANPDVPEGVTYQQLAHPNGIDMVRLVAAEFYDGKIFAAAEYENGDVLHFYDGVRVADWDAGSGATVAGAKAVALLTHDDKLYAIHQSLLSFSGVAEPTKWQNSTGAGFKNMSNQSAGSETLTGLARYQNLVAVFARRNTQIWYLDPDPLQNVKRQTLANVGTFAPRSIISFGDVDVFFLSDSGVRSLRARDSSNQSGVNDVGTPIDDYLLDYLSELPDEDRAKAVAALEPISGRYLLAVGSRVFVFSYFSSAKISAWSTYDLDFEVSDLVVDDGRVWARGDDTIYLLGGDDGKTYDGAAVEVELPYIDGRSLATFKEFTGLDVVCEGEWKIFVNTDPAQPDAESEIAIVNSTTLTRDAIGMVGHSPVVRLRFVSTAIGAAKLSKIVVHYSPAEAS